MLILVVHIPYIPYIPEKSWDVYRFFNHVLPPKKSPAEIGLEPKAQFSRRLNDAGTPWPRRRSDSLGMASGNYPI